MSNSLPTDLHSDFRKQIDLHWNDFLAGHSLPIGSLTFRIESDHLVIQCYSEKYFLENISNGEAKDRIDTAKEELRILSEAFPEFKKFDLTSVDYEFCFDTGKGAVLVACERGGEFTDYKNAG